MKNGAGGQNLVFVTDFDGTITDEDFFAYVKDAFSDDSALDPWRRYKAGEISHFEALEQIYGTLKITERDLHDLIKKIKVDEWVVPTFQQCHEAQIPIYIASAGCDYYINLLLGGEIKKYKIELVTNSGTHSPAGGLLMEKPRKDSPFYDSQIGISKKAVVKTLRECGQKVVFAGDGPPDFEAARFADVVFAKKALLESCQKEGVKTEAFDSFKDIYQFFERELGGRSAAK